MPGNIPYGESELSGTNEVPQLDRNETRETPGVLALAVESLSDEELGKTTEPEGVDLQKRKNDKLTSFNYTSVDQGREVFMGCFFIPAQIQISMKSDVLVRHRAVHRKRIY